MKIEIKRNDLLSVIVDFQTLLTMYKLNSGINKELIKRDVQLIKKLKKEYLGK